MEQFSTDTRPKCPRQLAEALFRAICGDFQKLSDKEKLGLIRLYNQISSPLRGEK